MPIHSEFIPPTIELGEHVLRPFRRSDAGAWFAYLSDPRVTEYTSWPAVTRESIDALVERVIADYATMLALRWAIARRTDDVLIGSCGYIRIGCEEGTAELAYDLAPAYWGSGIMTAAVRGAIGWASDTRQIGRIEALVLATNARSIAVLERADFKRDVLLKRHREVRGSLRDFYLYSLFINVDS
jgi:ribosomal-protein-alanine N-acetyltransferase